MVSMEGVVVLIILAAGFPIMVMESRKFPKMRYMLMGYACVIIAGVFGTGVMPGTAGITEMARSVSIMAAGMFFGAGAFLSFRRMKKVIK